MKRYGIRSSSKKQKNTMYYIRNFSRLLMGVLFIFSGYVKMVDPYGFSLKIAEIFNSFGMGFFEPASMTFAFLGIIAEFALGWALLFGIQMRLTAWGLMLFMGFFTLLTFWFAYGLKIIEFANHLFNLNIQVKEAVTDCGCFGDFVKLDNYETFYKNIIFMAFTLVVFGQRKRYKQQEWYYITQWFPMILVLGFSLFALFSCLRYEPWHDFRPWKVGNFIAGETYSQAPEVDFVFQYKNNADGSMKELTMDDLSAIANDSLQSEDFETNYTYHNRIEKIIKPGIYASLGDFSITDLIQKKDIKNEIITSPEYTFIIFIRDVTEITPQKFETTKTLIQELKANEMNYVVLTASLQQETEAFNKEYNTDIYFYYSDATPLKTAIRNNPGVILIKEGYVMDKWSYRGIPSLEDIKASFNKYEKKLEKYKVKRPPVLPTGENLLEIEETADNETAELTSADIAPIENTNLVSIKQEQKPNRNITWRTSETVVYEENAMDTSNEIKEQDND